MATAIFLPIYHPLETIELPIDYRTIQELVGKPFDIFRGEYRDEQFSIYVDDTGLIYDLPLNPIASSLKALSLVGQGFSLEETLRQPPLVGPALVTGPADHTGETLGIPDPIAALITRLNHATDLFVDGTSDLIN